MNCSLWINGKKVSSADEIIENYDAASVRGYFLGGCLCKWLRSHGGESIAEQLNRIDPSVSGERLNDALAIAFGQKKCTAPTHKSDERLIRAVDALRGANSIPSSALGSFKGSFGSFGGSWRGLYGSGTSFRFGSGSYAHRWEWEWEYQLGSFRKGSFGVNSFRLTVGSYKGFGGPFSGSFKGYGSFVNGSFRGYGSFVNGSFRGAIPTSGDFTMTAKEYDEIMYRCLGMCPLNRYGYGIHLIHG